MAIPWSDIIRSIFGGTSKVPTMTPQQEKLLSGLLSNLQGGGLGQGYGEATDMWRDLLDPSSQAYDKFTDPYKREFEQQTVPGLAERFAGMGAMGGGLSSSGFGQSLSAAAGNLQSNLAQLKSQLGMQAAQNLAGQYGQQLGMGLGAQPFAYKQQYGTLPAFLGAYGKAGAPGF